MPKFLIIRFSSIGDIIQCMGIIDGIREHFPDAEIHWIARKDMSSFLAMDKRIGKIWAFDKALGLKGLLKIARQLREEHYDYIYDAHSNIRSNILRLKLLPWWSKGPHFTLRSKERWKRFLLFNWGINRFPWPFRGVVSYRKPLLKWGIDRFPDTYDDWYFPENFPEKLNSRIQAHTITLVPSANWIKKRWPVEHWKKLITLLSEYHFLILAGPGDTFCEEIRTEAPEHSPFPYRRQCRHRFHACRRSLPNPDSGPYRPDRFRFSHRSDRRDIRDRLVVPAMYERWKREM